MNRILAAARPCVLLIAAASFAKAQQPTPAPASPPDEIGALRQAVEQQSKQIEALTQQVSELNRRLTTTHKEAAPPPKAAAPPTAPAAPAAQPPAPAPAAPQPPAQASAPAASTPAAQAAETKPEQPAADGSVKHTVAKGETLTSIAKRYNIPLSELEKANKITDDRKLQIGHVLNIPTTAPKASEPPTEKKENP